MRQANNIQVLSSFLCLLGAHIGHIHVDAYQSLSYYVLGHRTFFVVIDLDKTVSMLKKALVFFENVMLNFGTAVYCYSGVDKLSIPLRDFFSRIISAGNHSFSYWKWVPGCVTNYRLVFLRLVNVLFSDVRVLRDEGYGRRHRKVACSKLSFTRAYRKLWFWFLSKNNAQRFATKAQLREQFNSFFLRRKRRLVLRYAKKAFASSYRKLELAKDRDRAFLSTGTGIATYRHIRREKEKHKHPSATLFRRASIRIRAKLDRMSRGREWERPGTIKYNKVLRSYARTCRWENARVPAVRGRIARARASARVRLRYGEYGGSGTSVLPNFLSLLFRLCYIIRNRMKTMLEDDLFLDPEVLFTSIYKRLIVFWRAIIFFRSFKKTSHVPDCVVMLNPYNSYDTIYDFTGLRLPIICVADSTTDIRHLTYPIPSNDDSLVLLFFYFFLFLNASAQAKSLRDVDLLSYV